MIEVELRGHNEAISGEYSYSHPRKDPVAPLLRKMIADGVCSEKDDVIVRRGDMNIFPVSKVSEWTDFTIMCADKGGISKTVYRPFPSSVSSS